MRAAILAGQSDQLPRRAAVRGVIETCILAAHPNIVAEDREHAQLGLFPRQNRLPCSIAKGAFRLTANLSNPDAASVNGTSSYAKVFSSAPVAKMVDAYGGVDGEQAILHQLRDNGAIGVVVAVNGRILWADVFASTELLTKYWPKLMRSYVAEAITFANNGATPDIHAAEAFMNTLSGGREVVETEPNVYRRTDITGDSFRVFELMALLPKTGFNVHITKMRQ
jgi:hypothetical protein